jgi:hypothetical protein
MGRKSPAALPASAPYSEMGTPVKSVVFTGEQYAGWRYGDFFCGLG